MEQEADLCNEGEIVYSGTTQLRVRGPRVRQAEVRHLFPEWAPMLIGEMSIGSTF